jgi:two-component system CheB/CheR fusion protein
VNKVNGKGSRKGQGRGNGAKSRGYNALVGIGMSAVATDGLLKFFESARHLNGIAFAVVMQHREALDEAAFHAQLAAVAALPVLPITDGSQPQPGHIHVAEPNMKIAIRRGAFKVSVAQQEPGERGTIDSFLVSLAEEFKEEAIGIVLAETSGDGTLGVAALKENGCLAIAETPRGGLPKDGLAAHAATPWAIADVVLDADSMAERVAAHVRSVDRVKLVRDFDDLVEELAPQLTRIATILRNQTGHDFHGYKRNTFLRRVQRRIQVTQTETIDAYLDYLKQVPDEAQALFNDLLIGVTHFFRDQKEFEFLEREVIPKLFEGKAAGDQLRVWVLGCATGEEAYSIAILLREQMARLDTVPHIQIFATDIDGRALAQARVGRYGAAAVQEVTPERLARWFIKEGDTYSVVKELREMCIFSQHNIIKDAPFSRLDLVSCRNLLIYLSAELQNRVIPLFHFALRPGGFLFLGNSENVTRHAKLFAPLDRRFRIFRQQESLVRVLPDFPLTATADRRPLTEQGVRSSAPAGMVALGKQAERIMERYAPAYMIIDENHDILHFSGRTGRYIDPPTGVASLNLLSLIHRDLRMDLRAALHKAEGETAPVRLSGLKVGQNGHSIDVTLTVEPLETAPGHPRRYAVILQDGYVNKEGDGRHSGEAGARVSQQQANVEKLESELQLTRDRLQATIEELESTNEELKASNEEYQSVNEELQSSNEELETSKEELQSLNEELQTVNGELAHRVEELGRANSDLKNLLESTQIGTVFLDNDLRVKSFTPAITDIFHLIDSDLGRPIHHIGARIAYEDLESDVRKVLRTLSTIEREVRNPQSGLRYLTRVLPYRSIDNVIEGVVITFLDVTPLIRAEERLRESEARLRGVVEGIPQLVWRSADRGHWIWSSPQWTSFTGQPASVAAGMGWLEKVHPEDRQRVVDAWDGAAKSVSLEVDHRLWCEADQGYRNVHMRAAPVYDDHGGIIEWLGTSTDVNELLNLQHKQRILLAELQHRVRNSLAVVRSIARRSADGRNSVEEYASHLEGRIDALARVQGILTRTPDAEVDLRSLVLEELSLQSSKEGDLTRVEGPQIKVGGKAAEILSLAFHELATNSVKHGALSADQGLVEVSWTINTTEKHPSLHIRWAEKLADGAVLPPPSRTGFGTELIEKLVPHELKGTGKITFKANGMVCAIELPITKHIRSPKLQDKGRGDAKRKAD